MNHHVAIVSSTLDHDHPLLYNSLALPLCRNGWRVEIINSRFEGSDENRIRFRRMPITEKSLLLTRQKWRLITQLLLKSRADVCILHEPLLLPLIPKLKRLMPVQTIFIIFEQQESGFSQKIFFSKSFLRKFLQSADSVVVKTPEQAQLFEQFSCDVTIITDEESLCELCEMLEERGRYNV